MSAPAETVTTPIWGKLSDLFVSLAAVALMREVPLGGRSGIAIARERASHFTHDHQGATA